MSLVPRLAFSTYVIRLPPGSLEKRLLLLWTAQGGHVVLASELLTYWTEYGEKAPSVVYNAAYGGSMEAVINLINKNLKFDEEIEQILEGGCASGNLEVIDYAVKLGGKFKKGDLIQGPCASNFDIVQYFIETDRNLFRESMDGAILLHTHLFCHYVIMY